ncbi:MAG: AMP-binding protein, partial [Lysobacter sp.]|nr:AMP-binding protein [Lysobacter sp.]
MRYEDVYRRSIEEPEAFWAEQAQAIHWHKAPQTILQYDTPPFRRWFDGGETNLCYNAVDRHLAERADQLALVAISTETNITREISYRELHREVNVFAAAIRALGVGRGDRVVIYMPNVAEAVF